MPTDVKDGLESYVDDMFFDEGLPIIRKEMEWNHYLDHVENTGIINKFLIKGYRSVKKKKFGGALDSFLQVYFGGTMTRKDQDVIAMLANKRPEVLTMQNSLLNILISPQYYFFAHGSNYIGSLIAKTNFDTDTVAYSLAGTVVAGNIARMGLAMKNKRSYAGFGLDSIYMNVPSYIKRGLDKIRKRE